MSSFYSGFSLSYYSSDEDVKNDDQLQSFANEISADGTVAPDGGKGKVSTWHSMKHVSM